MLAGVVPFKRMPGSAILTCTGEGSNKFNATPITPLSLAVQITASTSPRVRTLGTASPHPMQYAGQFAYAYSAWTDLNGATNKPLIVDTYHVNFDSRAFSPSPGVSNVDTLIWRLPAGLTIKAQVTW